MTTITCTINIQRKGSGDIYYTGLDLPRDFIGYFLLYAIAGGSIIHRTITKSKSALPGLRFGDEYVGRTVDIIITRVDDKKSLEAHSRELRRLKEDRI